MTLVTLIPVKPPADGTNGRAESHSRLALYSGSVHAAADDPAAVPPGCTVTSHLGRASV